MLLAGGATGILSVFKEDLPQSLYAIFLYVVWWAIIIMLVWLVLSVILGESPKKVIRWIQKRTEHKTTQRRLYNWKDKFTELCDLVSSVAENDWQATEIQIDNYRNLHIWFKLRRSKILPLWGYFRHNRIEPTDMGV